ncbi:hypothetical protein C0Q70_21113 [Pomacea canaliculata]|uniref:propionyl-CoA carboxylase n=1 Tax=Pomacea canaliculata TaxID=400727 RepID=A0A2T7NBL6_POMCA|nr:hypothetical protein C0Q70_21113 [Pomacea canaliculata]
MQLLYIITSSPVDIIDGIQQVLIDSSKRTLWTSHILRKEMYWNDKANANETKFDKILIANRGEIACRVIKTCRRLGIKTVAVHSDVDSLAVHARMADEAVCIGPAPTSKSYLQMDKILQVIKDTGAQAVHPGYGFLSENTVFAARLHELGVEFIGPNSQSIRAMGDKIESKRIANKAGVNMIPGYDGVVEDVEHCVKLAKEIGYPVMIKASAGGGGKGMRIARDEEEARQAFRLCTEEAKSSFGDDRMLIEKFVEDPRHIEIQHILTGLRKAMGEQATALAKAVGYDSAGTVEFLVDSKRNFYFLEMNTRLQVEHPITECTTGIDIVHQMIRIAKGHKLLYSQSDVPVDGWSFECRVYAEVRCDSGVEEGSEISIYYDPMICKLVSYGPDRQSAVDTMVTALDSYVIKGVTHNIPLLRDIMTEERFLKGNISTNYLPEVFPAGFKGKQLSETEMEELVALACAVHNTETNRSAAFLSENRLPVYKDPSINWNMNVEVGGNTYPATVSKVDDAYVVQVGKNIYTIAGKVCFVSPLMDLKVNDQRRLLQFVERDFGCHYKLRLFGTVFAVRVLDDFAAAMQKLMPEKKEVDLSSVILAPMPGMLKSVDVEVGQQVAEGQEVCILEAMKMQNSLQASKVSKVKKVNFKAGDTVNEGDVLVELE